MAGPNVTSPTTVGNAVIFADVAGVNAGDILITLADASRYDDFAFVTTAGVLAVFVSLDGVNFEAIALQDLSAAAVGQTFVATLTATHIGRLNGSFRSIQVQQSGATAVANACMVCTKKGGQY